LKEYRLRNKGTHRYFQTYPAYLSTKTKHRDYSADKLKDLLLQMVHVFVNKTTSLAENSVLGHSRN